MVIYNSLEEALVREIKDVNLNGSETHSRGRVQRENLFRSFCILDPTDLAIKNPARAFNPAYAFTEWFWYLSKDPNVRNIGKFAKIWLDIADSTGRVESNYGTYLLDDQWQFVKDELKRDPYSRRCTIVIHQPVHKYMNDQDMPCTQYLQFFIRDNMLHMGVNMRSNDLVYGFCNDVFTFSLFQQLMLNELRIEMPELTLGHYYHHTGSMHVYERHFEMMNQILSIQTAKEDIGGQSTITHSPEHRFEMKPNVTLDLIQTKGYMMPRMEASKEDIQYIVNNLTEKLFK